MSRVPSTHSSRSEGGAVTQKPKEPSSSCPGPPDDNLEWSRGKNGQPTVRSALGAARLAGDRVGCRPGVSARFVSDATRTPVVMSCVPVIEKRDRSSDGILQFHLPNRHVGGEAIGSPDEARLTASVAFDGDAICSTPASDEGLFFSQRCLDVNS